MSSGFGGKHRKPTEPCWAKHEKGVEMPKKKKGSRKKTDASDQATVDDIWKDHVIDDPLAR